MLIHNCNVPFQLSHVNDKQLILQMLKYEDGLYLSEEGQKILKSFGDNSKTLQGSKTIQRLTLEHFNFNTSPEDLENYRSIFKHYYNSSSDYDSDILNSVFYMRHNRLLYYNTPKITENQIIPDVPLYCIDNNGNTSPTSLYNIIQNNQNNNSFSIVAGFSMS